MLSEGMSSGCMTKVSTNSATTTVRSSDAKCLRQSGHVEVQLLVMAGIGRRRGGGCAH